MKPVILTKYLARIMPDDSPQIPLQKVFLVKRISYERIQTHSSHPTLHASPTTPRKNSSPLTAECFLLAKSVSFETKK